ncbi:MAG: hypothetical protein RIT81_18485 [Deltaproteobacteria bacterium]
MRRLRAFGILILVATASPAFGAEVDRIRLHLRAAQELLAERDLSALSPQQRIRRAERLADLDAYIRRGRFPKNDHIPVVRAPYFIDDAQTHCAMAYLIARSGREDLVERVRSTANNAYVYELADDPELAAWLDENGLTIDEAATIQPSYEPVCDPKSNCVCQRYYGNVVYATPDTVLEVRVEGRGEITILGVTGTATIAVGERVALTIFGLQSARLGETYLVGRHSDLLGGYYFQSIGVVEDGEFIACAYDPELSLRLDAAVAAEAIIAADCDALVVAASADFEGDYGPDCGCLCSDVGSTTGSPSAFFLLALLWVRRYARCR